ncbi:hypothetical protein ACC695_40985, partial [Rhizobium ruizarguesonis]
FLASGTYINTSPTLVEINVTSLVRKTQSKVTCALVNPSQLTCTSDSGAQFPLSRRGCQMRRYAKHTAGLLLFPRPS